MIDDIGRKINKLRIYSILYGIIFPCIGLLAGFITGYVISLLLRPILNQTQSKILILLFSIAGLIVSIPIAVRQLCIFYKMISVLKKMKNPKR